MSTTECHTLLESKLEHANNDLIIFETKESTKSIAKLLAKYHENFDSYQMSNKVIFYPYAGLHFIKLVYVDVLFSDIEHKSQIQMLYVRILFVELECEP